MRKRELPLEAALAALVPVVRVASSFQPKLQKGVLGADGALAHLTAWAGAFRESARPLIWVHAPSVGEALMAQAIISSLREQRPHVQVAFTHLSPSAERMRDRVGADVTSYLPWDTAASMKAALDILQPSAVAFVRTEIWPALTRLAQERGLPVLLLNAVLAGASSRLSKLGRFVLLPAHERLAAVGAINAEVGQRFERLGVLPERIMVTGDARFDQVWKRILSIDAQSPLLLRLRDRERFTIVAGSTWPVDEKLLLPAFAQLHKDRVARLILAPHETTPEHLAGVERQCSSLGLATVRLSSREPEHAAPVIIVDRLGVLADLYACADLAYVGGAFHAAGVHSVVEPAALGVPVVIGPDHDNAAEAQELVDAGGALSVMNGKELQAALVELYENQSRREQSGAAARAFVQSRLGGAEANARLLLSSLD